MESDNLKQAVTSFFLLMENACKVLPVSEIRFLNNHLHHNSELVPFPATIPTSTHACNMNTKLGIDSMVQDT